MRVLFLDLDTLRPDHLSCYGYHRNTSPNIDTIAESGIRFDNYYCPNAPCLPSRASLVTGMYGIINGIVGHSGTAADLCLDGPETLATGRGFRSAVSENSLFYAFRKAGLYTASISTFAERHSAWWFNAGLNESINVGKGGIESGEEVLPLALDWIERNGDKDDWMLHVNLWDPHTPYRAPAEFGNPFEFEPLPEWLDDPSVIKEHLEHIGPHGLNELGMWSDAEDSRFPRYPGRADDLKGVRRIIDGYDCGIRFMDECIGKVFDLLRKKGIYDNVNIIITSDHGENFGELGIYGEHATADEATCRIPMIIRWNDCVPAIDNSFRVNVDLLPTLCDLLGVEKFNRFDGISYANVIRSGSSEAVRDYVVLTQCAHVCQRAVRFDNYLYIKNYHTGYHLFDDDMLFDLSTDPHEQHNIAASNSSICLMAKGMILDWQDKMLMRSPHKTDPLWTVLREGEPCHCFKSLPGYLKRLRETGRAHGAELLAEKYNAIF